MNGNAGEEDQQDVANRTRQVLEGLHLAQDSGNQADIRNNMLAPLSNPRAFGLHNDDNVDTSDRMFQNCL